MKPLSIRLGVIAALLLSLCTSFSPVRSERTPERRTNAPLLMSRSEYYYWYLESGDTYQGYWATNVEVDDLESEYQIEIDTNPSGGTPIANGFVLYGIPHMIWPSVNLYAHY
jgi:hypothetical protein